MSAARPAASAATARRPAPPPATHAVRRTSPALQEPFEAEDSMRLQLGDIPRAQESLDVDGFKPSLLSRLFDLLAPLKTR